MEPFIGEIRMFGGSFAPVNWAFCDGATLSISDYETLYTLLGTTYGGDGQTTFGLPNLCSRVPVGQGGTYTMGYADGAENVSLSTPQMPAHSHAFVAASTPGAASTPSSSTVLSTPGPTSAGLPIFLPYDGKNQVTLNQGSLAPAGGSQAHSNIQPSLAINFIIALNGIYPSQD